MFGTEQKVGLFIVGTLILLGFATFIIGDMDPLGAPERKTYTAVFSDVKGLKEQAPVRMAGVEVGRVGAIRLANGTAEVELQVRSDVEIPEGAGVLIGGSGLVGDKYVVITYPGGAEGGEEGRPGVAKAEPDTLPEGSTIREKAPSQDLDDLMRTYGKVGEDVQALTGSLREMVEANREDLRRVVANVRDLTESLKQDLPPMVEDFRGTAENANDILAENRENVRQLVARLNDSAANLAEITGEIQAGNGTIGKLYKEEAVYTELETISQNLGEITTKINEGEGALGKLVSDDEVGRQLESAVAGIGEYTERVQRMQTSVALDSRYLTEQETSKSDFSIRLQTRPTRYYLLGATSDGLPTQAEDAEAGDPLFGQEEEFGSDYKFTFMFGKTWPEYGVSGRIGMLQSTGGVGMSYYPTRSLELSADLWDFGGANSGTEFDGPQSRFMARYAFLDDHLLLEGGMHNAFSEEYRSPFIGLGLRFFDEDLKYLAGSVPTGGL